VTDTPLDRFCAQEGITVVTLPWPGVTLVREVVAFGQRRTLRWKAETLTFPPDVSPADVLRGARALLFDVCGPGSRWTEAGRLQAFLGQDAAVVEALLGMDGRP
jgi:hypothetical protein